MKDLLRYLNANKVKLIPLFILIFLTVATFVTLTLTKRTKELRSKAANYTATLSFSPTTLNMTAPQPVAIILNPNGQAVVGADIVVNFDQTKLTLMSIAIPTLTSSSVFKTYAPVRTDNTGAFDDVKVISTANTSGKIEFGIISFDWTSETLTTPNTDVVSPVAQLTFQAKAGATGTTTLTYAYTAQGNTTDSNVVFNPTNGDPEDILAAPTSTVLVTFAGPTPTPGASPNPSPSATPVATPGATPNPSATPSCENATCLDFDTTPNGRVDVTDVLKVSNRANTVNDRYNVRCPRTGNIDVTDVLYISNRANTTTCTAP